MKCISTVALYTLLVMPSVYAESPYKVTDMAILPPKFYVGDLVVIRLQLQFDSATKLTRVDELPMTKWLTITDVQIFSEGEGNAEVKIYFSSYRPGTHLIPELRIGDIVIRNLKVNTNSVLEEEGVQRLKPLQNQVVVPLTWVRIFVFLTSACIVPLLFVRGITWIVGKIRRYEYERKKRLPFVQVHTALNQLGVQKTEKNPKRFYQEISYRMREYLENRLGIAAETSTTFELQTVLPDVVSNTQTIQNIITILRNSDLVKFGKRDTGIQEMADLLHQAREVVENLEKEQQDVES